MRFNKLFGFVIGGTLAGLMTLTGIGLAQSNPVPDTFFLPLPMEQGASEKGEYGNVEVVRAPVCAPTAKTGKKGSTVCSSKTITASFNDKIRFRGIFTNFDPIMEGEACDSPDEADDNFLNSGGSTFSISAVNGGVTALCGLGDNATGIMFTLSWTPSKKANVAVPLNGTATWEDSNGNSGTADAEGTMKLIHTGVGDCGTWALDITFENVSASSLGADQSLVNIQMDYGSEVTVPGATSFGCLETLLDVEKNSFD